MLTHVRWRPAAAVLASVLALIVPAGCTPPPAAVEGAVTFDGKPLAEGSISFESADGNSPTVGGKIENGTYKVTGPEKALVGKKVVRITGMRRTGKQIPAGSPSPPGTMVDEIESVPAVYNLKSTLTADVAPGPANKADFSLKSDSAAHVGAGSTPR